MKIGRFDSFDGKRRELLEKSGIDGNCQELIRNSMNFLNNLLIFSERNAVNSLKLFRFKFVRNVRLCVAKNV